MHADPTTTSSGWHNTFLMEHDVKTVDSEIFKKDLVNTNLLFDKAKKTASYAKLVLENLNKKVLPRYQSMDLTSNIVKRSMEDLPTNIQQPQLNFKERLDKNNEKLKEDLKEKVVIQEKQVHFQSYSKKSLKTNNLQQQFNNLSNLSEITKNCQKNVGVVNVTADVLNKEENSSSKLKNLIVQRIPGVDLKPDLVTQKLTNIQIKPDNKNILRNYTPNIAYHELSFELEPEKCRCQSSVQPNITTNKISARNEIRRIIYEMLNNTSSNNSLSDQLNDQLQKIMIMLEGTECLEFNELNNLVEEQSMVGFNDVVIKKRLLEIAENLSGNKNYEISFDPMSVENENNCRQVIKRLEKIKNFILAMNQSKEFPFFSKNDEFDDKDFYEAKSNKYISVKEFLDQGSFQKLANSEMFKHLSVINESDSQVIPFFKEDTIQNPKAFNSTNIQNMLNNKNISQLKQQPESNCNNESQITLMEDFVSSKPLSNHSNLVLKNQLELSEKEIVTNNNNNGFSNFEHDGSSEINEEINSVFYKTNNDIPSINCEQLTMYKIKNNEKELNTINNIERGYINNQIQDIKSVNPSIQECQFNPLPTTFNINQHTDLKK